MSVGQGGGGGPLTIGQVIAGPGASAGGGGGSATQWPTRTVATDTLLLGTDGVVLIDATAIASGATLTVTIPQAALVAGSGQQQFLLKRVDTNAPATVLVQRDGTNTFFALTGGLTSITMAPGDAFWFSGDSANNRYVIS